VTTIDEKRVYAARSGHREAYLATDLGLAVVAVSADQVGEFGVVRRGTARAVAAADGRVAAAVDGDVRLLDDGDAFVPLEFGPAVAVGVVPGDGAVLAVDADGAVARFDGDAGASGSDAWTELGRVADVRGVDGRLLATADGVVRAGAGDCSPVGLGDVRDVAGSGRGAPLAATDDGLYALGNGWLRERSGPHARVAADPTGEGVPLAVASDGDRVLAREGDGGEWIDAGLGGGSVADVAVVDGVRYAVTTAGTVRVDAGDGVRSQPLGLTVGELAVR
jgi:hypothetical protein